ncbi:Cj0069 family protein [Anaerobacillus sp. CMMVII]|uniref:Cj0069 family protein n=1 Tax=Anaerobacillus sp. CMMVII TaxID=2755588 RepID=UPI0021B848B4|nr:Cj0069 family protein [Anaerobacillus sp. CMMVII]MCT8136826.1 Cj0069 family protein [Anaerobacillus sp. CMMVII]
MKKHVVFLEVEGGNDKGPDGLRPDTMPMINSLKKMGWTAEVIFYREAKKSEILQTIVESADAYVSRINPGNLEDETSYFDMLTSLTNQGVIGMERPEVMMSYGAKDVLVKLRDTSLVPSNTYVYYTMSDFITNFPKELAKGERVLKQNRGSTGEGIWRVELLNQNEVDENGALFSANVQCTEAKDNQVHQFQLGEFLNFCEQYIEGENGMLVDMPFLPRIVEGEIRILMINDKPVNVVHKKPAAEEHAFSATLFSGASYRYDSPSEWPNLISLFQQKLPMVVEILGNYDLPLIWTADFILDTDENGQDKYILGEMNCSCVGFTSHLELSDDVAEAIIKLVTKNKSKELDRQF